MGVLEKAFVDPDMIVLSDSGRSRSQNAHLLSLLLLMLMHTRWALSSCLYHQQQHNGSADES